MSDVSGNPLKVQCFNKVVSSHQQVLRFLLHSFLRSFFCQLSNLYSTRPWSFFHARHSAIVPAGDDGPCVAKYQSPAASPSTLYGAGVSGTRGYLLWSSHSTGGMSSRQK